MNMLVRLDMVLLQDCESLCHKIQSFSGVDNFWIARIHLIVFFVLQALLGTIGAVAPLVSLILLLNRTALIEQHVKEHLSKRLRSSWSRLSAIRLLMTFMCLMIAVSSPKDIWFAVGVWGWTYYSSCTPMPPGESKISAFIKARRSKRVLIPANQLG